LNLANDNQTNYKTFTFVFPVSALSLKNEHYGSKNIKATLESSTKLILSSINLEDVGLLAAKIRNVRPPEPYKGKGIRYFDEFIRRKAGKTRK